MKTLSQVKEILKLARAYCWSLNAIERGTATTINNYFPSLPKEAKEDQDLNDKEVQRLIEDSMKNLESTVKGFDADMPGRVFSITYATSKTSHSSGRMGPLEFTLIEPSEPQPIGGSKESVTAAVTQYAPDMASQLKSLLETASWMQNANQSQTSSSEALYRQLVVQYHGLIETANSERRQLRQDYNEKEDRLEVKYREKEEKLEKDMKAQLERHKEILEERNQVKLDGQLGAVKNKKAKAKAREAEALKTIEKAKHSSTMLGNGFLHGLQRLGAVFGGEEDVQLAGPSEQQQAQQEAQAQQQADPWRQEVNHWAANLYRNGSAAQLKQVAQVMELLKDETMAQQIERLIIEENERRRAAMEGGGNGGE